MVTFHVSLLGSPDPKSKPHSLGSELLKPGCEKPFPVSPPPLVSTYPWQLWWARRGVLGGEAQDM